TQYFAESILYDEDNREIARGSGTFVRGKTKLTPEIGYQ
ncbi:MAG: thioesterase, partial [Deltaproteobacteria bacterium HGW-Deltaproteobacteria-1]